MKIEKGYIISATRSELVRYWIRSGMENIMSFYDYMDTMKRAGTKIIEKDDDMGIKDSGTRRKFGTGAVRDAEAGKGRCDLLPACAILRLARHFEAGANKYDERNWEQGIPVHSFIDSAIRHLMKYLDGWTDEDHLCAAAWNCVCAMWTEEKRPEMQDIPSRMAREGIDKND